MDAAKYGNSPDKDISKICNVSATNFCVKPDFSAVFGYANVNCLEQQNAYQTPGTLCFWGFLIKDGIKQL